VVRARSRLGLRVNRHVTVINRASTVKAERYVVAEGKMPETGGDRARAS
jgi:hypothetical protein